MKRFLSVFLLVILLLGFLPALVLPARMITYAQVSANRTSAYVGDQIAWTVSNEVGSANLLYYYTVYFNGIPGYQSGFTSSRSVNHKPGQPGTYKAFVLIQDAYGTPASITVHGPDVAVTLRPAPKITKVEALGGTSLKIAWNRIAGADGYFLERSTSKTSGYTAIKTTGANSYTDTGLTPGKRYFYRVRTYNLFNVSPLVSGNYSAPAAGIPLAKPAVLSAVGVSASGIRIAWKKVAGATGYQVLMSATAGGTYKAVKSTTALSTTMGGLRSEKTYYFKVRPYKQIGAVKYYGPLSGYKAGRTK